MPWSSARPSGVATLGVTPTTGTRHTVALPEAPLLPANLLPLKLQQQQQQQHQQQTQLSDASKPLFPTPPPTPSPRPAAVVQESGPGNRPLPAPSPTQAVRKGTLTDGLQGVVASLGLLGEDWVPFLSPFA